MPRDPIDHEVKTWPEFFQQVWDGIKPFELRYNDRDYQEKDRLILREWCPVRKLYTGRRIIADVLSVISWSMALQPGHVAMGLHVTEKIGGDTPHG